jgi:alkylation response protein AidB-like acyl-CoA dehydrogenase
MRFLLHDVFDVSAHFADLELAEPIDRAFVDAVLDEAYRFTEGELAPLNRSGDEEGCTLRDGEVATPKGFKAAYQTYIDGGWAGLLGDPAYGGQGLPGTLGILLEELMATANMAWTMYPGLSRGCMHALEDHGSEEQKQQFLTHLLSGRWTGTMCLTEPHAGSDVGLARTRAEAQADGSYRITGTKIFISAGEHDLSENIVHLVLARLPDAPSGTKGISMFVVPKFDLDGTRNAVVCGSIEEKMGIHGNATCVLNFDGARGYLVGEENQGMRYMFTMMNDARLGVGLQGVCLAQRGFEASSRYAQERLQMRSLTGPKAPDQPADPIVVHPDVRRMLLTQRAIVEGGRALVYHACMLADRQRQHPDEAVRGQAGELLDLLTPIVKGFLTEAGYESVNAAVQVYGGHGFIREHGVEQLVRDGRITLIYEGTTGIQALDLLARKVLMTQGKGLVQLVSHMKACAQSCEEALPELAAPLANVADEWAALSMQLGGRAVENADEVGAASVDYLFYSGYAVLAYMWAQIALAAQQQLADSDASRRAYLEGKIHTARFYFARMLPRTAMHRQAMEAGAACIMEVADDALVAAM